MATLMPVMNSTNSTYIPSVSLFRNSPADELFLSLNILLGITGSASNGFVLYVVINLSSKGRSHFIINQLICDLTASMVIIITYAWKLAGVKLYGVLYKIICLLIGSEAFMWICLNSSVTNLVFISMERFVMVKFPFWYRNHQREWGRICNACIVFLWIDASLRNLPTTWVSTDFSEGRCRAFLKWPRKEDGSAFTTYYTCVVYIIPIVVFIIFYTSIFLIIRQHNKVEPKFEPNMKADSKVIYDKTEMTILKTMIIITLMFFIFWFPETIYFILMNIDCCNLSIDNKEWLIVLFIGMSTSCINPFVYGLHSGSIKTFLKKFKRR